MRACSSRALIYAYWRGKKMIDEEATFEKFGYYSTDWAPKSNKKIVAVCDDCGKVRVAKKQAYHALCLSCVSKGAKSHLWKGGLVKRRCEFCNTIFPVKPSVIKNGSGKFCSRECARKWLSKHHSGKNSPLWGENNPAWKNGASFEPYCHKFNFEFKEYIRDKFGRVCFLCGKTKEENGKRLSVHHCNGNKNCGCDGDETCQFVPLCKNCHSKVHSKKVDWESKIKAKMKNKLNGWYI